uniref:Small integral membrane protein 19 n=1 Tax=Sinocyclocheilus grahami TaxID=75366 RepID=A0A672MM58_SINGR
MGGYGAMADGESLDYSVHEAWNEATNVYLLVILVSFALLMYARKNKRKIMRIFTLPRAVASSAEPSFYDSLQKVRLRQQLEMYSLCGLSSFFSLCFGKCTMVAIVSLKI